MNWTIEAKVLPLAHFGGHLYLEIFDPEGKRVCQINGLSYSHRFNKIVPMGIPGDQLKAYVCNRTILGVTSGYNRDNHPHKGYVIYKGSEEDIQKIITATKDLSVQFNDEGFLYNVLSFNSNTVFSSMLQKISEIVDIDQKAVRKAIAIRLITPGVKTDVINGRQNLTDLFNGNKQRLKRKAPPKPAAKNKNFKK